MRTFLFTVLMCAAVGAVGCGSKTENGVRVDSVLRRLVPPDATVLAGVNVAKLERSPLYQRYEGQLDQTKLDGLAARLGIDPRRDVTEVLVAATGQRRIALARGRFDEQQLKQKFTSAGMRRSTYHGHELFSDGRNGVTFAGKDVMAAGELAALKEWVDRIEDRRGGIPETLQQRLAALPKDDSAWLVSDGGLPLAGVPIRQDVQSALSNIEGFVSGVTAGVAVDSGVHFRADLNCISPEGAQRVHDALRGGIGLARLATNDNALDMLRLYDAIDVNTDKNQVHVKADLASDLTDKVWARLPQVMQHINGALERVE